ncbi:YesL family protein [Gracilibacillus oryzae]|uniref:YesL family protein n=1 Tax=Gracilibacillus oryzae TaxID=1672701 RepID=A0A7C8GTD5_9BACI|nr:YesL family protein [Gracilibacillus oryzae]KAB8136770.1 YesL family protein [Gracilibacillus oryzae]
MDGWFASVYRVSEWIARLIYVNVMWIVCTIIGLGILGLFPATSAMFAVTRRWVLGERDVPIFKLFWQYFKADFKKSNILGYIVTIVGVFIYVDFKFFQGITHPVYSLITMIFMVLLFLYFTVTLYIFPIFVHYDMKVRDYIKYAFIIAIGRPVQTLAMLLGVIVVYLLYSHFPGIIPFVGASLLSFVLMQVSYFSFGKLSLS